MSGPVFAVVGHPNKGKSSIVSTLAQDDSVHVAPEPGTTVRCRSYPLQVDGQVLYTLVDTPGFQRARRAWAWMRERGTDASTRRAVVESFVAEHRDEGLFFDECELLTPVLDGAGILYVVDGSVPYGPEYEAEMEILRWTGQPSMALINCIGAEAYVAQWQTALGQFFKVVRVFNAMTSPFHARTELLDVFGQLEQGWREQVAVAVRVLREERARQASRAGRIIAEQIADMLSASVTERLAKDADPQARQPRLEETLKLRLREREQRARKAVETIYAHRRIERIEDQVELDEPDLFSTEHWYLWGLSRNQLVATGAAGGAVVGGAIDVGVGGASLMLGTALGAVIGGVTALLGGAALTEFEVLTLPLGGLELRCGPVRERNFPYVVLGRALHHHALISTRAHANRAALELREHDEDSWAGRLEDGERRALEAVFSKLRDGDDPAAAAERIAGLITPVLARAGPE